MHLQLRRTPGMDGSILCVAAVQEQCHACRSAAVAERAVDLGVVADLHDLLLFFLHNFPLDLLFLSLLRPDDGADPNEAAVQVWKFSWRSDGVRYGLL